MSDPAGPPNSGTLTIASTSGGTSFSKTRNFANAAVLSLIEPYTQQQSGEVKFSATAAYEQPVALTAASGDVTVTFVAPHTVLSAPTLTPTAGEPTAVTATVTVGAGGAAVNGATVRFTVATTVGKATPIDRATGKHRGFVI